MTESKRSRCTPGPPSASGKRFNPKDLAALIERAGKSHYDEHSYMARIERLEAAMTILLTAAALARKALTSEDTRDETP